MLYDHIQVNQTELKNRLVMPPMATEMSDRGRVTAAMLEYYGARARYSAPGLIITEHCCITEAGRASAGQLSIAEDGGIEGHRRLADAIHKAGSRVILQLNHGGSGAEPYDPATELVSASDVENPRKNLGRRPRPLTVEEIHTLQERFAEAADRAMRAGYDGVEVHSAHGYLLDQFYSPLTNHRKDEYGAGSLEDRTRFLRETMAKVREAIGADKMLSVRLGGADYMHGGATEEDAAAACRLIEGAGADLLDISGGMCGFILKGRSEAGYFGSMTEKIRAGVSVPVLLTGGITKLAEAEALLEAGKADLIGVGRALYRNAHWASEN